MSSFRSLARAVFCCCVGFIRRFAGEDSKQLHGEKLVLATEAAINNLGTFWIVGVVEQYPGFLEVLKRSLDPSEKHPEHWDEYGVSQYNK